MMRRVLLCLAAVAAFGATAATGPAYAQGGITTSLSGIVVDTSGGVLPGAQVTVKNVATNDTYTAVTGELGTFTIPALLPGTYTVTVTLDGFKTVVLNDVVLNAATPGSVRATMEVGGLQETVTVEAASSLVQTQTSAVSTTLNVRAISSVPLASRNVLDFIPALPGVSTPRGNRQSTINGLPRGTINITYDGINVQDNTLRSTDGFFTIVQPRLDAVEEVTVTTAAQGADSAGQGAVHIRFVTRSGTNEFRGSAYHYYRNDSLNANTWFNKRNNLPKPELVLNQPGIRVGGPIVLPGLVNGQGRAFFFVNYEEFRQPQQLTRDRTILHPRAELGFFRYNVGGSVREVNLLELAAAHRQIATPDPTIVKLLADIRAATTGTGAIIDLPDPLFQRFSYNLDQRAHNRFPTVRLDFNLSDRHRLAMSGNYHTFLSVPDTLNNREPFFPGFPATGTQTSKRLLFSSSLRSTLSSAVVNELRVGGSGAPVFFFKELSPSMWGGTSVADQGGFHLDMANALGITNAANTPTPSSRNAYNFLVENTLSWLKGSHALSFGASFTDYTLWLRNQTLVPTIRFGVVPGDPAEVMFTPANFPGASAADLARARAHYAVLTGRVSEVLGNARIDESTGEYVYLGAAVQRARMRDLGFWAQDAWRLRTDLTLNYGLRYELQTPFYALNNSYSTATFDDICGISGRGAVAGCNLFAPGATGGKRPEFVNLAKGVRPYKTDWNNVAPSVGIAWTPTAEGGFLRRLLGQEGDTVIRGGYVLAYNREGMANFTGVFGANPGILINVRRTQGDGNLGPLPLLFRDRARLDPPPFPRRPEYPMVDLVTEDVNIFDPNLKVPYAQTWNVGIQRALGRNMAVEVRYVGTRFADGWETVNYNEINVLENGFLQEFRRAQANLRANIAAGRGATFRYFGPGTNTEPLPIFLAYFQGLPASAAGVASNYTSTLFASSTFLAPLAIFNPQPYQAAALLFNDAGRRANAVRAGLPENFFVANPHALGGAFVTRNGQSTRYNSLQIELRRRMAGGLQFDANYTFGISGVSEFYSFRLPRRIVRDSGDPGEVTHAWKGAWVYELPFGRGRRFASAAGPLLDRIIGGWSIAGILRIQTGELVNLGNVRMVGFNEKELREMFKIRIDQNRRVWTLPQDVIDNTVRAFNVSATSPTGYGPLGPPEGRYFAPANGPDCLEIDHDGDASNLDTFGECGPGTLIVRGPLFKNLDLSILKQVPIRGRVNVELRLELLNALNNVNFVPVGLGFANANGYEVTTLTGTAISRTGQIVARLNW
ncbi:MAG TPA: TonB-dependent receptor [Vicinamibacterales bacterium]|nr:TonB-dependent receptor [Vicinamibacterales bacterium]